MAYLAKLYSDFKKDKKKDPLLMAPDLFEKKVNPVNMLASLQTDSLQKPVQKPVQQQMETLSPLKKPQVEISPLTGLQKQAPEQGGLKETPPKIFEEYSEQNIIIDPYYFKRGIGEGTKYDIFGSDLMGADLTGFEQINPGLFSMSYITQNGQKRSKKISASTYNFYKKYGFMPLMGIDHEGHNSIYIPENYDYKSMDEKEFNQFIEDYKNAILLLDMPYHEGNWLGQISEDLAAPLYDKFTTDYNTTIEQFKRRAIGERKEHKKGEIEEEEAADSEMKEWEHKYLTKRYDVDSIINDYRRKIEYAYANGIPLPESINLNPMIRDVDPEDYEASYSSLVLLENKIKSDFNKLNTEISIWEQKQKPVIPDDDEDGGGGGGEDIGDLDLGGLTSMGYEDYAKRLKAEGLEQRNLLEQMLTRQQQKDIRKIQEEQAIRSGGRISAARPMEEMGGEYAMAMQKGAGEIRRDITERLETSRQKELDRQLEKQLAQIDMYIQKYGVDANVEMAYRELAQSADQFVQQLGFSYDELRTMADLRTQELETSKLNLQSELEMQLKIARERNATQYEIAQIQMEFEKEMRAKDREAMFWSNLGQGLGSMGAAYIWQD